MAESERLTGVWDGLYRYPAGIRTPESTFTAVLFDGGGALSGTIHETMKLGAHDIPASAFLEGRVAGRTVTFLKTYDGSGGQSHSVSYDGTLGDNGDEIEGEWRIHADFGVMTGRFVMIRARRHAKAKRTRVAEKA
ncbi:MAG: hypothetical protein IT548_15505 [Alphaproteobacteria bacterium]|nr:hypothetical protein [Alphaproteobacteria bacterium]